MQIFTPLYFKKIFLHVIEQARRLASMKRKINFATWWRYISGRKLAENATLYFDQQNGATRWRNLIFFHTNNTKFSSLSHAKNLSGYL